ncbi:hypothetical protein [Candidatus Uabimicrobium amorphum]|uniref:Uncharacterized protein n=1 Tax=Uabimicrobium amorphum TaxID=2596890 RepID=A0A5S9IN17_UABAM|nr:hypothetical protein [Candidatus Uabimicrobium amorphum]BBM84537.1 hypothetical protein UABAM_02898 [Candidatus Uabimicrobium amorphum]
MSKTSEYKKKLITAKVKEKETLLLSTFHHKHAERARAIVDDIEERAFRLVELQAPSWGNELVDIKTLVDQLKKGEINIDEFVELGEEIHPREGHMRVIKSKTLRAVEPHTEYRGCTFYLEGPQCLDDCVFDNCSFRGKLHYVENIEKGAYPSFRNCSFNCNNVACEIIDRDICDYKNTEIGKLLAITRHLKITQLYQQDDKMKINMHLPKIKTVDLSAYESYRKIPVDWFERFPTLQRVTLPADSGFQLGLVRELVKNNLRIGRKRTGEYTFTRINRKTSS